MPYPRKLLNPGEKIAFELHPHWWYFAGVGASSIVVLAALVAVPILFNGNARKVLVYAAVGLAVICLAWFLLRLVAWRTTHFVLTSDRIIFRSGVLGRSGREIPLERVNDLSFHQSLFERIVGTGDLMIESAGRSGQDRFSRLPHPDRAQQGIYAAMEANRRSVEGSPSGVQATPDDETIPQQIADLARLHDQGVLSDDEFQAKKAELLKRM